MINYKLTKQLQKAGFPEPKEIHLLKGGCMGYFPTLSELIEACGDGFHKIERIKTLSKDTSPSVWDTDWVAIWRNPEEENPTEIGSWNNKTPEEAVAKLWLKLNEK